MQSEAASDVDQRVLDKTSRTMATTQIPARGVSCPSLLTSASALGCAPSNVHASDAQSKSASPNPTLPTLSFHDLARDTLSSSLFELPELPALHQPASNLDKEKLVNL